MWTNHYDVHDWTPCVGIPSALPSDCVSLMSCGRSGTAQPKHICHVLSWRHRDQLTPTSVTGCAASHRRWISVHKNPQKRELESGEGNTEPQFHPQNRVQRRQRTCTLCASSLTTSQVAHPVLTTAGTDHIKPRPVKQIGEMSAGAARCVRRARCKDSAW